MSNHNFEELLYQLSQKNIKEPLLIVKSSKANKFKVKLFF